MLFRSRGVGERIRCLGKYPISSSESLAQLLYRALLRCLGRSSGSDSVSEELYSDPWCRCWSKQYGLRRYIAALTILSMLKGVEMSRSGSDANILASNLLLRVGCKFPRSIGCNPSLISSGPSLLLQLSLGTVDGNV